MKPVCLFISLLLSVSLYSCTLKSDHPQADLLKDQSSTGMNDKLISEFAETADQSIGTFERKYSLIYLLGDNSLYVEQYTKAPDTKIYYEYASNGSASNTLSKYYFKNDSLVLIETNSKQNIGSIENQDSDQVFKDTRIYLRNNTVFKKENRTAISSSALKTLPYLSVSSDKQAAEESYFDNIKVLDDAIRQTNKFEMVFDNITTYPDSRYLILKSKIPNSYRASILVENRTGFIDSLLNNPSVFKDEKLNFKWKIKENEAVYIPAGTTSASGLNK